MLPISTEQLIIGAILFDDALKAQLDELTLEQLKHQLKILELNNGTVEAIDYVKNLIIQKEATVKKQKESQQILTKVCIVIGILAIIFIIGFAITSFLQASSKIDNDYYCHNCQKIVHTHKDKNNKTIYNDMCDECGHNIWEYLPH